MKLKLMTADLNEVDRLRRAFTATFSEDAPRADCPPAERIWEGLCGELGASQIRQLVDHLARCPLCAESWRLARELEDAAGTRHREVRRPGVVSRRVWLQGLAVAATVVLAVGFLSRDVAVPGPDRAASVPVLESRVAGPLPRAACRLRWTELEGAAYDVEVAPADLAFVVAAARDLDVPEFLVPPEALAGLPPGTKLKVYVEAYLPDGSLAAKKTLDVELE